MKNQALMKQRFWFLLPVALIMVMIGFFLLSGPRGEAAKQWAAADENVKNWQKLKSNPVTSEENIKAAEAEADKREKQKRALWITFYDVQNRVVRGELPPEKTDGTGRPMGTSSDSRDKENAPILLGPIERIDPLIVWPRHEKFSADTEVKTLLGEKEVKVPVGKLDFMERIVQGTGFDNFRLAFPSMYPGIVDILDWYDAAKGTGSVRARGAGGDKGSEKTHRQAALEMLHKGKFEPKKITDYEAWTLIEDVAVKREILLALAEVNKLMGDLHSEWVEVPLIEAPKRVEPDKDKKDPTSTADGSKPNEASPMGSRPSPPATPSGELRPPGSTQPGDKPAPPPVESIDNRMFQNKYWATTNHWAANAPKWTVDEDGKFVLEMKDRISPQWDRPDSAWQIHLEVVREGGVLKLQGVSLNTSWWYKVPATPLTVFFVDTYGKPLPETVVIEDAGDLGVRGSTLDDKPANERKLKPVILPEAWNKHRWVRIQRIETPMDAALRASKELKYLDQKRVANREWVMDLRLAETANPTRSFVLEGTVFNPLLHQQKPVVFVVKLRTEGNSVETHRLRIPGRVIHAQEARQFKFEVAELDGGRNTPPTRVNERIVAIEAVHQELDTRTVPIKQLEAIELGAEAHKQCWRKKDEPLSAYPFDKKLIGAKPQGRQSDPAQTPAADQSKGTAPKASTTPVPKGLEGHTLQFLTVDDLVRYEASPTMEVRRLPIYLSVAIDQKYVNELLTALANSRLRIQVTQTSGHQVPAADPGADNWMLLKICGVASIYESPDLYNERLKRKAEAAKPATPAPASTP